MTGFRQQPLWRPAAVLVLVFLAAGTAAARPPAHIEASYDLLRNGLHVGVIRETYEEHDGTYRIVSETTPAGWLALISKTTIRIVSSGTVTPQGLKPLRFEHQRSGEPGKSTAAEFDWNKATLTLLHDGKTEAVPLPAGTQDRLSAMYQFIHLDPAESNQIGFFMTNGARVSEYRYRVSPGEYADTPMGRLAAVRLTKKRQPDEDSTDVWLARDKHFFPVRMVIHDSRGDTLEQVLTSLSFR